MRVICIALFAVLAMPVHAALYKWIDAQGGIQYSDTPPPPSAKKILEQRVVPSVIGSDAVPFAVQDAAKRNPVTLWTTDCGQLCTHALDYLAKRGVPHSVRNPSRDGEQEAWKKASSGEFRIPLLVIGAARTLTGFNEDEWSAALDAAGYPRNAPSVKPAAVPPADPQAGLKPPPQAPAQIAPPAEEAK